jgi:hypothetical protein
MSSQAFLLINISIGAFLLLLFWFGRGRVKEPARLRLKGGPLLSSDFSSNMPVLMSAEASHSEPGIGAEKNLNVIFMYNGHSWDAHEVLGIPAGARLEVIVAAYQKALNNSKPDSHPFIEMAFRAIRDRSTGR